MHDDQRIRASTLGWVVGPEVNANHQHIEGRLQQGWRRAFGDGRWPYILPTADLPERAGNTVIGVRAAPEQKQKEGNHDEPTATASPTAIKAVCLAPRR